MWMFHAYRSEVSIGKTHEGLTAIVEPVPCACEMAVPKYDMKPLCIYSSILIAKVQNA